MKHWILAFFSLALLAGTFVLPVRIGGEAEAKKVFFGQPFPFAAQDFSDSYGPDTFYPWWQKFEAERSIAEFSGSRFFASFAAILLGLEVLIFILEWGKERMSVFLEKRRMRRKDSQGSQSFE